MSSAGTAADASAAAAAAASAAAAAASTAAATPWYADQNYDAETVGHIQNRGWDKDVKAAAAGAIKAHREAEKHIGVPANRQIIIPADPNDTAAWKANVWSKLGAPADAAGYDFTNVKNPDGSALSADQAKAYGEVFAANNIPKSVATALAAAEIKRSADATKTAADNRALKVAESVAKLKANWGPNEAINKNVARIAAERMGFTKEDVEALESSTSYDRLMEAFRRVGAHIGEDAWKESGNGGGGSNTVMTAEQALARKKELLSDPDWTSKYMPQNGPASQKHVKEMEALNALILGSQQ